jgi:hypothetical protein
MSLLAFLLKNVAAVVASIGAAITLGTFLYKDVIERRRRRRLAIAMLAYQIHLLRSAIDSDSKETTLLSPGMLHPFADVFLENDKLLVALTDFGTIHGQWERSRTDPESVTSADRTRALDLLTQRGSEVYSMIERGNGPVSEAIRYFRELNLTGTPRVLPANGHPSLMTHRHDESQSNSARSFKDTTSS